MPKLSQPLQEVQADQKSKSLDDRLTRLEGLDRQIDILSAQQDELRSERVKLEKRAEELDTREARIKQQEVIAHTAQAELDIITKRLAAKESILENVEAKISRLEDDFIKQERQQQRNLDKLATELTRKDKLVQKADTVRLEAETIVADLQSKADVIQQDIKAGKQYLTNQEQVVNDTVADWNAHLTTFQAEADNIAETKNKYNADIIRLEQELQKLTDDYAAVVEKIRIMEDIYQEKIVVKKGELADWDNQLASRKGELSELELLDKGRQKALEVREKSLAIKETALQQKDIELRQKERYIESRTSML